MQEKTIQQLKLWEQKTGRPLAELQQIVVAHAAEFKKSIPNKDEGYYEDLGLRKLFLEIKSELTSPAKPYDFLYLGSSGEIDVAASEMEEKRALYTNLETRAQAVAERKIYVFDPTKESARMTVLVDNKKVDVPDGTPLDTREWLRPPNPEAADERARRGFKNRNFGKPMAPFFLRTVVGFGRPAKGGDKRLVAITAMGKNQTRDEHLPPEVTTVRARLNLQDDRNPAMYVCNTSTKTQYTSISMPEFPTSPVPVKTITDILQSAPANIRPSLAELMPWHKTNEKNAKRLLVFEGDVTRINREPTPFGSYLVVIEDTSAMDLEAEGTPIWLTEAPDFGIGSRVVGIARTNVGPGFNRETGQLDQSIERVQLNACCIFAIPEFRVPPEEESLVEGEPVK